MGFEPMTYRVGVCHSIQLGYGYTLDMVYCSTSRRNEQGLGANISSCFQNCGIRNRIVPPIPRRALHFARDIRL